MIPIKKEKTYNRSNQEQRKKKRVREQQKVIDVLADGPASASEISKQVEINRTTRWGGMTPGQVGNRLGELKRKGRVVRLDKASKQGKSTYREANAQWAIVDGRQYARMKNPVSVKIKRSRNKGKKFVAEFIYSDGTKSKTHFGASGYSDYTKHKDAERKERYLARHQVNEDWNDPTSAGALSRWVLWNKPDLDKSIEDYEKRFNLKSYNRLIGGIGSLRGDVGDPEIFWTKSKAPRFERTPANVHEERLDRLSELLDSDIEYLSNGEQRMVYSPTESRPGELDGKVLKVSRYYVYDVPPKQDFSTGFWEDHVSLHFAEKTPFMLDFVVPGEPVLPPLETDENTMAGASVIQPKVKVGGNQAVFTDDIGKQWYSDVRKTVLDKYEQGKIDGETKDALIDWASEQDLGDGNFGFYEGEWRLLDYYGIPEKYFEIDNPKNFFVDDFEERDQDGEGADQIEDTDRRGNVREIDWDFDDSELIGWQVDEVDLSDEGGRDNDYMDIPICLGCGVSPGACVCVDRKFNSRKRASLPTNDESFKRRRSNITYMAKRNVPVNWRTPAPTRSIEKVMWDRWDNPGTPNAMPMTKSRARAVANSIRSKKAGGGVHLARVVPVKGGYLVYERPKDRKWKSSGYIKRQKMNNRGPGGNLYLRRR